MKNKVQNVLLFLIAFLGLWFFAANIIKAIVAAMSIFLQMAGVNICMLLIGISAVVVLILKNYNGKR